MVNLSEEQYEALREILKLCGEMRQDLKSLGKAMTNTDRSIKPTADPELISSVSLISSTPSKRSSTPLDLTQTPITSSPIFQTTPSISSVVMNPDTFVGTVATSKITPMISQVSPISPKPPEPPDYNQMNRACSIKVSPEKTKASSSTLRRKVKRLVPLKFSCDELYERMNIGLCVFCDEVDTPDHYQLKHKGFQILVKERDDDQLFDHDEAEVQISKDSGNEQMEVTLDRSGTLMIGLGRSQLKASDSVLQELFQPRRWSFSYNKMPQNMSDIMRVDCTEPMFNIIPHREELLRTRRNQKMLKSWRFKFKEKSKEHILTNGLTVLIKQRLVCLSSVTCLGLNGDNQMNLGGIFVDNEDLLEKFSSMNSYYKAHLLLDSTYIEYVGGTTHVHKRDKLGLKKKQKLGKFWHFKYKNNTRDKHELHTSHLNLLLEQRGQSPVVITHIADRSLGCTQENARLNVEARLAGLNEALLRSYTKLRPLVEQISRDSFQAGCKWLISVCSAHKAYIMDECECLTFSGHGVKEDYQEYINWFIKVGMKDHGGYGNDICLEAAVGRRVPFQIPLQEFYDKSLHDYVVLLVLEQVRERATSIVQHTPFKEHLQVSVSELAEYHVSHQNMVGASFEDLFSSSWSYNTGSMQRGQSHSDSCSAVLVGHQEELPYILSVSVKALSLDTIIKDKHVVSKIFSLMAHKSEHFTAKQTQLKFFKCWRFKFKKRKIWYIVVVTMVENMHRDSLLRHTAAKNITKTYIDAFVEECSSVCRFLLGTFMMNLLPEQGRYCGFSVLFAQWKENPPDTIQLFILEDKDVLKERVLIQEIYISYPV